MVAPTLWPTLGPDALADVGQSVGHHVRRDTAPDAGFNMLSDAVRSVSLDTVGLENRHQLERPIHPVDGLWSGSPSHLIGLLEQRFGGSFINGRGREMSLEAFSEKASGFRLLRWRKRLLARIQPEMWFHYSSAFLMV
jgi:hypothetical protein